MAAELWNRVWKGEDVVSPPEEEGNIRLLIQYRDLQLPILDHLERVELAEEFLHHPHLCLWLHCQMKREAEERGVPDSNAILLHRLASPSWWVTDLHEKDSGEGYTYRYWEDHPVDPTYCTERTRIIQWCVSLHSLLEENVNVLTDTLLLRLFDTVTHYGVRGAILDLPEEAEECYAKLCRVKRDSIVKGGAKIRGDSMRIGLTWYAVNHCQEDVVFSAIMATVLWSKKGNDYDTILFNLETELGNEEMNPPECNERTARLLIPIMVRMGTPPPMVTDLWQWCRLEEKKRILEKNPSLFHRLERDAQKRVLYTLFCGYHVVRDGKLKWYTTFHPRSWHKREYSELLHKFTDEIFLLFSEEELDVLCQTEMWREYALDYCDPRFYRGNLDWYISKMESMRVEKQLPLWHLLLPTLERERQEKLVYLKLVNLGYPKCLPWCEGYEEFLPQPGLLGLDYHLKVWRRWMRGKFDYGKWDGYQPNTRYLTPTDKTILGWMSDYARDYNVREVDVVDQLKGLLLFYSETY